MLYGGKVIMAIATTGGNAFVGSWDQQYTSAMGMWNYQAQLWFGAADGGGTPSAGYLSITGLRVQTATGCYIMSGSSLYAQGDTNFGLFQTGSSSRHMQFAGNWHWAWDMSSGALGWNTPSGQAMSIIYAGINVSGTITSGSNQTNGTLVVTGTAYLNATTQFYSLPGFSTFGGGANGRYYQLEGNHYIVKDPATADGNHYNGNGGNIYHQNTAGWSRIQSDGQFVISSNGWKPGGGSWADSSDARIKRVHADYTRGLAEIIQLHPRIYSFLGNEELILRRRLMNKSARSMGHLPHVELDLDEPYPDEFTVLSHHADVAEEGNTYIGLVAQEAEAHMPEMVSLAAATIDGEIVADLRMMDTSALPYAMINAFKEIDARLRAGGL
jgi:hypothetical protein